jgi:hypothetical protein
MLLREEFGVAGEGTDVTVMVKGLGAGDDDDDTAGPP